MALFNESIAVVRFNEVLIFQDKITKDLFDSINVMHFTPKGKNANHFISIKLIRNCILLGEGDYDYYGSRDNKLFCFDTVIPSYWQTKGIVKRLSHELLPIMFQEKDEIEIIHNSKTKLLEKVKPMS